MMATKWMGGPLPRKLPEAANYGAVLRYFQVAGSRVVICEPKLAFLLSRRLVHSLPAAVVAACFASAPRPTDIRITAFAPLVRECMAELTPDMRTALVVLPKEKVGRVLTMGKMAVHVLSELSDETHTLLASLSVEALTGAIRAVAAPAAALAMQLPPKKRRGHE